VSLKLAFAVPTNEADTNNAIRTYETAFATEAGFEVLVERAKTNGMFKAILRGL
jgi:hypothetical protein